LQKISSAESHFQPAKFAKKPRMTYNNCMVILDSNGKRIQRTVVFDVETTGLSPRLGDRIIEIGAVALEGKTIVDEFHSLISVDQPILSYPILSYPSSRSERPRDYPTDAFRAASAGRGHAGIPCFHRK